MNNPNVHQQMMGQKKCGLYVQWNIIQLEEGNSDTCDSIDKPWKHYAKWITVTEDPCSEYTYEID